MGLLRTDYAKLFMNEPKDLILYVMSGTGNTYRMAQWIKEMADQRGMETDVAMIDDITPETWPDQSDKSLVGVLFPAHGFMPPWSMIKFLFQMPRAKGIAAFCGATRGGIKLGPVVIPGAVGIGNFMAALILFFKGYRVKALFSLDMPANLINLHWGMLPKNIALVKNRSRKKLDPILKRILDHKTVFFTLNNLWELAWGVLMFWLIPLFPILYLLIARINMGKLMFSNNQCIGCGLCSKFCSSEAILMKNVGGKKRPFWTYHCEACLRCMGYCKKKAIEAGHSWAVLLYFITSVPVFSWLIKRLHDIYPVFPIIQNYWLNELFNIIYFFPAMILSYRLFWTIVRVPAINSIFSYTTLTHFFRRYHEPETKLKHLKKKRKQK
jgi:Pyruvate/2-oxoacid:ferredoxin oxidoreductase delta subunit